MQEIKVKEKNIGLKVFINDVPNLKLVSKERVDSIIKALEMEISLKTRPNDISKQIAII